MGKYSVKQLKEMNELLQKTYLECMADLNAIEIPISTDIRKVEINTRAQSRWSMTHKRYDEYHEKYYTIDINADLCTGLVNEGLRETMLHELIHTCESCMNHGDTWLSYVAKCNSIYGTKIKRASNADDKGFTKEMRASSPRFKYEVICLDCDKSIDGFSRETKTIKNVKAGYCSCGRCHGHNLKVVQNW